MHEALRAVYGIHDPRASHIDPAGRTDLEIARAILLDLGLDARHIDERLEDLRAECASRYARLCPRDLSQYVIPGVSPLLADLDGRPEVRLSLVTGNLEPIARLKLLRSGLSHYFPSGQGAFGSDEEDRTLLPAIARQRARHNGRAYPRAQTLLIGDTPRDIACAHADGLRCMAVATGPVPAERLTDADAVAADTAALHELLDRLLSKAPPA